MSAPEISFLGTGDCGPVHGPKDGFPLERYTELVRPTLQSVDLRFGNCERQYSSRGAASELAPHGRQPPEMAKLTRAVLAKLRTRFPGAVELVYDKKRGMVVGFCPDERASNVINSIGVYSKWINLYFFEGDTLPDPEGLLQGSGHTVRNVRITSAADLDRPGVKALMAEALKRADPPLNPKGRRRVIIRQSL